MKLYFFYDYEVMYCWKKHPVPTIYEIEAQEKSETYELDIYNPVCYAYMVRKSDMITGSFHFFVTKEEAEKGLINFIEEGIQNQKQKAEKAMKETERLEKMLREVKK